MNCSSFFNCKVTTDFSLSIYGSELPKTGNAFSANLIDHSHPFNRVSSCCCDCLIVGRIKKYLTRGFEICIRYVLMLF